MKKGIYLAIVSLALLIFPIIASANPKVTFTCESDYETKLLNGGTASCDFYLDMNGTTDPITKFTATIVATDLDIITITRAAGWSGSIDEETGVVSITHSGATAAQKMFTIEFELADGASGEDCGEIIVNSATFTTETPISSTDLKNPETSTQTGLLLGVLAGISVACVAVYIAINNRKVHNIKSL